MKPFPIKTTYLDACVGIYVRLFYLNRYLILPQSIDLFLDINNFQVTNPAIDPLREGLVMSLEVNIGKRGNILEAGPENASQVSFILLLLVMFSGIQVLVAMYVR